LRAGQAAQSVRWSLNSPVFSADLHPLNGCCNKIGYFTMILVQIMSREKSGLAVQESLTLYQLRHSSAR
jgi:hypothetical protein